MCEEYRFLDSGNGRRLESFGEIVLDRPAASAVWRPESPGLWKKTTASVLREKDTAWQGRVPQEWKIQHGGLDFWLKPTAFGHVGLFPEHESQWPWIAEQVQKGRSAVLNLFAYSGGASLVAAKSGANVCHVDASQPMVDWARKNAQINHLQDRPIRWIVDDVIKFLKREERRERKYDLIILDPPSFGRGKKGEVFKIEEHLLTLLHACRNCLSEEGACLFSCHTPGYTPIVLEQLLLQVFGRGKTRKQEMVLSGESTRFSLPLGSVCSWEK